MHTYRYEIESFNLHLLAFQVFVHSSWNIFVKTFHRFLTNIATGSVFCIRNIISKISIVKLWIILLPIYQATRKIIEYNPIINCPFLFIELSTRGAHPHCQKILILPKENKYSILFSTQNPSWGVGGTSIQAIAHSKVKEM